MMRHPELAKLRMQLREVNIEYSALVRAEEGSSRGVRMELLRQRRVLLMDLIAQHVQPAKQVVRAA